MLQRLAILHMYRCNAYAQQQYQPDQYAGRITLFHAQQIEGNPSDPYRWHHLAANGLIFMLSRAIMAQC